MNEKKIKIFKEVQCYSKAYWGPLCEFLPTLVFIFMKISLSMIICHKPLLLSKRQKIIFLYLFWEVVKTVYFYTQTCKKSIVCHFIRFSNLSTKILNFGQYSPTSAPYEVAPSSHFLLVLTFSWSVDWFMTCNLSDVDIHIPRVYCRCGSKQTYFKIHTKFIKQINLNLNKLAYGTIFPKSVLARY